MTKTTKILLGISLASLLISLTGVLWGLFLPVGVICFGLFLISNLMAKEVAMFDEEQRSRRALAERHKAIEEPLDRAARKARRRPSLSTAHSH